MGTLIDKHTGIAKLRPKQGEKPRSRYAPKEINHKEIEICLNCKKPDCTGNCKKIKEEWYDT